MAEHHSIEDWDRSQPSSILLTDAHYVSEPSSLLFSEYEEESYWGTILSRHVDAQDLAEGRIVTQFQARVAGYQAGFTFRNQAALGTSNYENCYLIVFFGSEWHLDYVTGGVEHGIGATSMDFPTYEWIKLRLSWWNGYSDNGLPALAVMLERYIDGEWVKQGDTLYDEDNHFKDSETNRCGLHALGQTIDVIFYDDTEIWERET
ncbi:unnamed protein product [marine sediment metagenome]|uniref:Uncharacterized protein n=1 Tax=marine sediment metagenome TaxID=412755 RepID=X1JUE3_9ZZZZ